MKLLIITTFKILLFITWIFFIFYYLDNKFTDKIINSIFLNLVDFLLIIILFFIYLLSSTFRFFLFFNIEISKFVIFLKIHLQGYLLNTLVFQSGNLYRAINYQNKLKIVYYNFIKYFLINSLLNFLYACSIYLIYISSYFSLICFIFLILFLVKKFNLLIKYQIYNIISILSLLTLSDFIFTVFFDNEDYSFQLSIFNTIINSLPFSSVLGFTEAIFASSNFIISLNIKLLIEYSTIFKLFLFFSVTITLTAIYFYGLLRKLLLK